MYQRIASNVFSMLELLLQVIASHLNMKFEGRALIC